MLLMIVPHNLPVHYYACVLCNLEGCIHSYTHFTWLPEWAL